MLWYIAAGSAIGGVSRYLVGGVLQRAAGAGFPIGTLVVNLTGSFLLGLFLRYAMDTPTLTPEWRAFLTVGFCGGYTTFSPFAQETLDLLEGRHVVVAAATVTASVTLGLVAVYLGAQLGRLSCRSRSLVRSVP